jgi:hypothetical protein
LNGVVITVYRRSPVLVPLDPKLVAESNYAAEPDLTRVAARLLAQPEEDGWPPQLREWHRQAQWIPLNLLRWWVAQQREHDTLDPMPLTWWLTNVTHVAGATLNGRPIGAVALQAIARRNRELGGSWGCYLLEARGWVVDDTMRQAGVGGELMRTILLEACRRQSASRPASWWHGVSTPELPLRSAPPTVAVTSNPRAARMLERLGGRRNGHLAGGVSIRYLNALLCWDGRTSSFCSICPQRGSTAWWFPTNARTWQPPALPVTPLRPLEAR